MSSNNREWTRRNANSRMRRRRLSGLKSQRSKRSSQPQSNRIKPLLSLQSSCFVTGLSWKLQLPARGIERCRSKEAGASQTSAFRRRTFGTRAKRGPEPHSGNEGAEGWRETSCSTRTGWSQRAEISKINRCRTSLNQTGSNQCLGCSWFLVLGR